MRRTVLALLVGMAALGAGAESWKELSRDAKAAYDAREYPEYEELLRRLLSMAPHHPVLLYNLAGAEALEGRADQALKDLRQYASMGLAAKAAEDADFASLHGRRDFEKLQQKLDANARPVGRDEVAFRIAEAGGIAEDIVFHAGSFYVSSVRTGRIYRVTGNQVSRFAAAPEAGWSSMALAVDAGEGQLFASVAALPQAQGYRAADKGRSAILRFDLAGGRLLKRYEAPAGGEHVFGDMTLDGQGNLIVSDSRGGLYRLLRGRDTLQQWIGADVLVSPQTPAASPDGRVLVPDYGRGIAVVEPGGQVGWLEGRADLALTGIDGLYLAGRNLLAIQNGTDPQRLLRIHLDRGLRRAEGWQVLAQNTSEMAEPTHGVIVGKTFYFIGASGWKESPSEPAVLKLGL